MKHQHAFAEDLSALLRSGTPLEQSLNLIEQHHPSTDFQNIIARVKRNVQQGQNLSIALAEASNSKSQTFSPLFIGMIQSGEVSGDLPTALSRLAAQLERDHSLTQKIQSALVYPTILIVGMFISLVVIFSVVIPQFAELFSEYGEQLSSLTKGLMHIGNFINQWGLWLLAFIVAVVSWLWQRHALNDEQNSTTRLIAKIPYLRSLYRQIEYSRFCYSLSSLLKSGLPQTQALAIAANTFEQQHSQQEVNKIIVKLNAGHTLGECFAQLKEMNPLYAHSIANAEPAGELPLALEQLAVRMEKDFNTRALRLTQIVEPVLVIILGLVIGVIVYALFSSLASLGNVGVG